MKTLLFTILCGTALGSFASLFGLERDPVSESQQREDTCVDADIHDECLTLCRLSYMECLSSCDEDSNCQSKCRVDFGFCDGSCPCGFDCPDGCDGCNHPLCDKCKDAEINNENYKRCVILALEKQNECIKNCPPDINCMDHCYDNYKYSVQDCPCIDSDIQTTPGYSSTTKPTNEDCDLYCENGGFCFIDNFGDHRCACPDGFQGKYCEYTPCYGKYCDFGKCIFDGQDAVCECYDGYSGEFCERTPCDNVYCPGYSYCEHYDIFGTYECRCEYRYAGPNCDQLKIDRCESFSEHQLDCKNRGECWIVESEGSGWEDFPEEEAVCVCEPGYSGELCEITPCSNNPCLHNGECFNYEVSYVCNCTGGYSGKNCEIAP